jgi:uncharacterized phiE125 gp8 family phage protein
MPITLADAKQQLRVDIDDDDALIQRYINGAAAYVERHTGQLLTRRQVSFSFDAFVAEGLELTAWPSPADATISYRDPDGVDRTLSSPRLLARRYRPKVLPARGTSWPATDAGPEAVLVTVTAGFDAGQVEPDMLVAVQMLVAHWYRNREAEGESTPGVDALLGPHRKEFL